MKRVRSRENLRGYLSGKSQNRWISRGISQSLERNFMYCGFWIFVQEAYINQVK